MKKLSNNPLARLTLAEYGARLRRHEMSVENVTTAFLERIESLNPRLNAFHYVARDEALAAARILDQQLAAGNDLGPLMGVPVAVKDLYSVAGMPTNAGSNIDVSDIIPSEGTFVDALKRSGCVILGKTRSSEFALGGINFIHPVPWNPWDAHVHRMPGGSSHGSAVAVAAGLCAFAIGSDTGGSVRLPAALCGVVGHKFTSRAFPLDGIFPLSPTLDSVGTFTTSVADSSLIFSVLTATTALPPREINNLRLGKPLEIFFDDLEPEVMQRIDIALDALEQAGAKVISVSVPEIAEFETVFNGIVPAELIDVLGRDRITRNCEVFDAIGQSRVVAALDYPLARLDVARKRQAELRDIVCKRMRHLDNWITPTVPFVPGPVADGAPLEAALAWNRRALRNTRIGNVFDQCGISLPLAGHLPVGLQITCAPMEDAKLLALAATVESIIGRGPLPEIEAFFCGRDGAAPPLGRHGQVGDRQNA